MDPGDPYAGRRRGTLRLRLRRQHHRHYGCERKHHYLPLQQLRTGMRDPGFGRTQRVLLLRRRRPSGDAHRPQREHGAYPVTTWTAACTIRPTGRQVSVAVFESTGGGDGAEGTNRAEVSGGTRDVWKQRFVQLNRYDGENLRYETEENGKVIRFLFDRGELGRVVFPLFRTRREAPCSCWMRRTRSGSRTAMTPLEISCRKQEMYPIA